MNDARQQMVRPFTESGLCCRKSDWSFWLSLQQRFLRYGALFRCVLIASSIDYERPISLSFQMSKRHTNMTTRQPRHSKSYRVFCDTVVVLVFGIHVELFLWLFLERSGCGRSSSTESATSRRMLHGCRCHLSLICVTNLTMRLAWTKLIHHGERPNARTLFAKAERSGSDVHSRIRYPLSYCEFLIISWNSGKELRQNPVKMSLKLREFSKIWAIVRNNSIKFSKHWIF